MIFAETSFLVASYREQENSPLADEWVGGLPQGSPLSPLVVFEFENTLQLQVGLFHTLRIRPSQTFAPTSMPASGEWLHSTSPLCWPKPANSVALTPLNACFGRWTSSTSPPPDIWARKRFSPSTAGKPASRKPPG